MNIEGAFVTGKQEVKVAHGDKELTFYANEIGYLASQTVGITAQKDGKNGLALLVAESITDTEGNKFTYDEVMRLTKEFAEPLFEAVVKLHGFGGEEKN